jgi:hypothetical protein
MINLLETLDGFAPISLGEMDAVKLLNRQDVKFMFHRNLLPAILEELKTNYRILSIDGKRFSRYETRYFDTADMKMYIQHHNGKMNRHKVRFREYIDSGLRYFEIKFKTNKGRTIKDRVKLTDQDFLIQGELGNLLTKKTGFLPEMLQEAMHVRYNRITLVQKNLMERLTLDIDLNYAREGKTVGFPQLVIAEVKQDRSSRSPFTLIMQNYYISTLSISKYCLGIASLNPDVKINNFKKKLLHVKKLCNSNP